MKKNIIFLMLVSSIMSVALSANSNYFSYYRDIVPKRYNSSHVKYYVNAHHMYLRSLYYSNHSHYGNGYQRQYDNQGHFYNPLAYSNYYNNLSKYDNPRNRRNIYAKNVSRRNYNNQRYSSPNNTNYSSNSRYASNNSYNNNYRNNSRYPRYNPNSRNSNYRNTYASNTRQAQYNNQRYSNPNNRSVSNQRYPRYASNNNSNRNYNNQRNNYNNQRNYSNPNNRSVSNQRYPRYASNNNSNRNYGNQRNNYNNQGNYSNPNNRNNRSVSSQRYPKYNQNSNYRNTYASNSRQAQYNEQRQYYSKPNTTQYARYSQGDTSASSARQRNNYNNQSNYGNQSNQGNQRNPQYAKYASVNQYSKSSSFTIPAIVFSNFTSNNSGIISLGGKKALKQVTNNKDINTSDGGTGIIVPPDTSTTNNGKITGTNGTGIKTTAGSVITNNGEITFTGHTGNSYGIDARDGGTVNNNANINIHTGYGIIGASGAQIHNTGDVTSTETIDKSGAVVKGIAISASGAGTYIENSGNIIGDVIAYDGATAQVDGNVTGSVMASGAGSKVINAGSTDNIDAENGGIAENIGTTDVMGIADKNKYEAVVSSKGGTIVNDGNLTTLQVGATGKAYTIKAIGKGSVAINNQSLKGNINTGTFYTAEKGGLSINGGNINVDMATSSTTDAIIMNATANSEVKNSKDTNIVMGGGSTGSSLSAMQADGKGALALNYGNIENNVGSAQSSKSYAMKAIGGGVAINYGTITTATKNAMDIEDNSVGVNQGYINASSGAGGYNGSIINISKNASFLNTGNLTTGMSNALHVANDVNALFVNTGTFKNIFAYSGAFATGNNFGDGTILNEGDMSVEAANMFQTKGSSTGRLINTGTISVDTSESSNLMDIEGSGSFYNSGIVNVSLGSKVQGELAYVTDHGKVMNAKGGAMTVSSSNAAVIYLGGSSIGINQGIITLDGSNNSYGMYADKGGVAENGKTGIINILNSDKSVGMCAASGGTVINHGSININGSKNSTGIEVDSGGFFYNDGTITIDGSSYTGNGNTSVDSNKNQAILNNGTIYNGGNITALDANLTLTAKNMEANASAAEKKASQLILDYGGTIKVNSITGDLKASAGIARQGSLQNTYTTKNAVVAVENNATISSNSAMFDANLTDSAKQEKGYTSKDIIMNRISFDSLVTDKQMASILEDGYVVGSTNKDEVAFYNALSTYSTSDALNAGLDALKDIKPKQRYYSSFNNISYGLINHNTDILVSNIINKTSKKGYSAIAGINYGANSGADDLGQEIQGYSATSYNAYFGFSKRSGNTNKGLLGSYTTSSTTYTDSLGTREDVLMQLSSFMNYSKNNFTFTGMVYGGYDAITTARTDGSVGKQDVALLTKFTADSSNMFFGGSLNLSKKYYKSSSFYYEPLVGVDATMVMQGKIDEKGNTVKDNSGGYLGGLNIAKSNTYLVKPSLGLATGFSFFQGTLNLSASAKAIYNLGNLNAKTKASEIFDTTPSTPSKPITLSSKDSMNVYEGDLILGANLNIVKGLSLNANAQFNAGDKKADANGGVSLVYIF